MLKLKDYRYIMVVKYAMQSLLICLTLFVQKTLELDLSGTEVNYIKYPPWKPCHNGSLSFQFKTSQSNALLLYSDEETSQGNFVQIKLVDGSIVLDIKLGQDVLKLTVGSGLNDRTWHKLQVIQKSQMVSLIVDKTSQTLSYKTDVVRSFTGGFVYIGGIPPEFGNEMSKLSLPSVLFEPRLHGSVRNVLYKSCSGETKRPAVLHFEGVRNSGNDQCVTDNPCHNNGICVSTDKNTLCDCSHTNFSGLLCTSKNDSIEVSLFGKEYIRYDLLKSGNPIVSNKDMLMVQFKTLNPDGLLIYAGQTTDYIIISLKQQRIHVSVNLGSGEFSRSFMDAVNDNQWHEVKVTREAREIVVSIDGTVRLTESTSGNYSVLTNEVIYVGGYPRNSQFHKVMAVRSFSGCMRKVIYEADDVNVDVLKLAESKNKYIKRKGDILFNQCQSVTGLFPVTFHTPDSYLQIKTKPMNRDFSLSLKFKTNEKSGLLLYCNQNGGDNFIAVELADGFIYFLTYIERKLSRMKLVETPVTDGHVHHLKVLYTQNVLSAHLDDSASNVETLAKQNHLTLSRRVYLGGVSPELKSKLQSLVWSLGLGHGFVGCVSNVIVNNEKINLGIESKNQNLGTVISDCNLKKGHCSSHPCLHQGICVPGWNRYICICHHTAYYGQNCQKVAPTVDFNGKQHVKIVLPVEYEGEAEDISLRFKTKEGDGLLFETVSDHTSDSFHLSVSSGQVVLVVNLGQRSKTMVVQKLVNDHVWHSVLIGRRASLLKLKVDDLSITDHIDNKNTIIDVSVIKFGQGSKSKTPGFIGTMQQFIFNDKNYFELLKRDAQPNFELTAAINRNPRQSHHSVTFKSFFSHSVIRLPQQLSHKFLSIYFFFRTTERDGLLLYAGLKQDFLALELTDGQLYLIYSIKYYTSRVRILTQTLLNDNQWHEVTILRPHPKHILIRVDSQRPTDHFLIHRDNFHITLSYLIYLAGMKRSAFKQISKKIYSRHGFQGCLASVEINGISIDILDAKYVIGSVEKGCTGPTVHCQPDSCMNTGRCIQHWTSYKCNCDLTSYTGARCADESTYFKFGDDPGLIIYSFQPDYQPTTTTDSLAFGLVTYTSHCGIFRIDSSNLQDYLELEIVDGMVYAMCRISKVNYVIGELFTKINDGSYHIVRFVRHGTNFTLQLDNLPVRRRDFIDGNPGTFVDQSLIQIGGQKDDKNVISKPFIGTLHGLVFNGINVLEMAAKGNNQVSVEGNAAVGDIEDSIVGYGELDQNWQSTEGTKLTTPVHGITDDIIFVSPDSECHTDSEINCMRSGSENEDDIIIPVITVSPPTSKPRSDNPSSSYKKSLCVGRKCGRKGRQNSKKDGRKRNRHGKGKNGRRSNSRKKNFNNYEYAGPSLYPNENSTLIPDNESNVKGVTGKGTGKLDIGLIIGIAVGVIVALVILAVLLYKYRTREHSNYKVEETQTFAFVADGNKNHTNGHVKSVTPPATKSKKKDVKEWYV